MPVEFNSREAILIAIVFLFTGRWLNKRIHFLHYYNIPEPVTGGLLASLIALLLHSFAGYTISFDLTVRDALLIIFFTTIGLSARFSDLAKGGKPLMTLLILSSIYLFVQNGIGIGIASLLGLDLEVGLLGGSVSMSGGHGTAIAWGEIFKDERGISNAPEIGVACATFGLVAGGLIGGPIAGYLIRKKNLSPSPSSVKALRHQEPDQPIDTNSVMSVVLILAVAVSMGVVLHDFLLSAGLRLPTFVSCLFSGIIINNVLPHFKAINLDWPKQTPTISLISDLSLGIFLSMSLMSLQLWTLAELAGPLLIMMVAQVLAVAIYIAFVVFRLLGKQYDAAIISAGIAGLTLGATPTAFVNMNAVTQRYGPSPMAYIIVPLIGAFFIDIANAICIQFFLEWFTPL